MVHYTNSYWNDVNKVALSIPNIHNICNHSILITGATGMIGSSVTEILLYLNREQNTETKLYLAGRNKKKLQNRFYEWKEGLDYFFVPFDAAKINTIDIKADYIIHGASPADPASYNHEPVETMMANIFGLKSMLDLAKEQGSQRVLYISSSEVYGKKKSNKPYSETDYGYVDISNPRACYPSAKRASETLCAAYKKEYNVDYVIVRPGHVYGPSITTTDSRASAQFTKRAAAGENIILKSAGSQMRSYCYTLDCASAILTVLLNGKSGEAYNISNPDSICSIRTIAEVFAAESGNMVIFENPSDEEKAGYNLMDNSSLSADKIYGLGWHGWFNIEYGVKETLKFYRR